MIDINFRIPGQENAKQNNNTRWKTKQKQTPRQKKNGEHCDISIHLLRSIFLFANLVSSLQIKGFVTASSALAKKPS